jgi:hypothetical protein
METPHKKEETTYICNTREDTAKYDKPIFSVIIKRSSSYHNNFYKTVTSAATLPR